MSTDIFKRFWLMLLAAAIAGCSGGGAFEETTDTGGTDSGTSGTKVISDLPSGYEVAVLLLKDGEAAVDNEITQFADGASEVELQVHVKTSTGLAPSDPIEVLLSFSEGSVALARVDADYTDTQGVYRAYITNQKVQPIHVTPIVGGEEKDIQTLYFVPPDPTDSGDVDGDRLPAGAMVSVLVLDPVQVADGASPAELMVVAHNKDGRPLSNISVALAFSSGSFAVAASPTGVTDANGQFSTGITNRVAQNVRVTPIVGGVAYASQTLSFSDSAVPGTGVEGDSLPAGADVDIQVLDNDQVADGSSPITLLVAVRDANGIPLPGISVQFAFSEGSFAVITSSSTVTDSNGLYSTGITDLVPQTVLVTPIVGGVAQAAQTIRFISGIEGTPSSVTLIVPERNAVADGSAGIELIVVPRDNSGVPIAGVPVALTNNSSSALFTQPSGETGTDGTFRTTLSSTVPGPVTVTAKAGNLESAAESVQFIDAESGGDPNKIPVGRVTVPQVHNNGAPAGSQDESITVTVFAYDTDSNPAAGRPTTVILSGGSAIPEPATGVTDESGRFIFTLKDSFAETFTAKVDVDGFMSPNSPLISFTGLPTEQAVRYIELRFVETTDEEPILSLQDDPTPARGVVIVRRVEDGMPVAGVEVELSAASTFGGTVEITPRTGVTNIDGSLNYSVTSIPPEGYFNDFVTVTTWLKDNPEVAEVSDKIHFALAAGGDPSIGPFDIELVLRDNNQPADGSAAVLLDVFAKTDTGQPVPGAIVTLFICADGGTACTATSATALPSSGLTDESGRFSASITNIRPESVRVRIQVDRGSDTLEATSEVINFLPSYSADTPPARVEITADPLAEVAADGKTISFIKVQAFDAEGRAIANAPVTLLSTGLNVTLDPAQGSTGNTGTFSAQMTSTEAGTAQITAAVGSVRSVQPAVVEFTTEGVVIDIPANAIVQLTVDKNSAQATGADPVTLTAIVSSDNERLPDIPVSLRVERIPKSDEDPDDPVNKVATALFGPDGGSGTTSNQAGDRGTFTTTLTSTADESVIVTAQVGDKRSAPVNIAFAPAIQEAASLVLLASSPQLLSGTSDGVTITALLKDSNNNPIAGNEDVRFIADSGTIEVLAGGATDAQGKVQAILRSEGEPDNRTIEVTASAPGIDDVTPVTVDVTGTTLKISGPTNTTSKDEPAFIVSLQDSTLAGIGGKEVTVTSQQGNTLVNEADEELGGSANLATDQNGQITFVVRNPAGGEDTLAVTYPGATQVNHSYTVSNDIFCVAREPHAVVRDTAVPPDTDFCSPGADLDNEPVLDADIALNTPVYFTVYWERPGETDEEKTSKVVRISTTRGLMLANTVNQTEPCEFASSSTIEAGHGHGVPLSQIDTIEYNQATFMLCSNNAGPATIDVEEFIRDPVSGAETQGPATQFRLDFIADQPSSLDLQADPSTIGVNTGDQEDQRSEVIAVVRDADNNLVAGERVEFALEDVTGGRILPSFAVTDSFGRASVVYIAGSSPSAAGGVRITARLSTNQEINDSTAITVANRSVYINIGLSDKIADYAGAAEGTTYSYSGTIIVNDVVSGPTAGAEVDLRVIPLRYGTGFHYPDPVNGSKWLTEQIGECISEDRYWEWQALLQNNPSLEVFNASKINNGILDTGEDLNGNCRIDPGEDIDGDGDLGSEDVNCSGLLEPGNSVVVSHEFLPEKLVTDEFGFAQFDLLYPKEFAHWVQIRLEASTIVAGSEGRTLREFWLPASESDMGTSQGVPANCHSPWTVNNNAINSGMCTEVPESGNTPCGLPTDN